MVFRQAFLERRENEFQNLFAQIMERRDPGFQRVRPWGNQGDRKNDGWSPARRMLFQCYAPSTLTSTRLESKLADDYEGAIHHWEPYFDTWVFVHNDRDGMAPAIAARINELDSRSEHVACVPWGFAQLREEFACLHDADRRAILGPPLTPLDFLVVDAASLRPLIEAIGYMSPDPSIAVDPVPVNKIEANALEPAQVEFLRMGSGRAPLVADYLENAYLLPSHADSIAEAVSDRYRRFRDEGRSAAEVFDLMLAWTCGGSIDTTVTASALAVLAYFFDRCHIFEIPDEISE